MASSIITEDGFVIPKKKRRHKDFSKPIFISLCLVYGIVASILFYFVVNFNSIILAFTKTDLYGNSEFVWFDNFVEFCQGLFSNGNALAQSFQNSMLTWSINLVISLPLYIIFSYQIYKKCFLHKTIRAVSMMPQIISGFVVSMLFVGFISGTDSPMYTIFEKLGINDSTGAPLQLLYSDGYKYALGTMIFYGVWVSFGTNLLVYPNAMNDISPEIIEASRLDGVRTMGQDLWHIILPLIFPTLETFFITGVASIFTHVGYVLTFFPSGVPNGANVSNMGYYYFINVQAGTGDYSVMSAGGVILTLIAAPITLLLRWLLEKFGPSSEAK